MLSFSASIHRLPATGLLILTVLSTTIATAENNAKWELCPPRPFTTFPLDDGINIPEDDSTHISADNISASDAEQSLLKGNVIILRQFDRLRADIAQYDQSSETLNLEGNILYQDQDTEFKADKAKLNANADTGYFENVDFFLRNSHASGEANNIIRNESNQTILNGTRYSSCDPSKPDWYFKAKQIELDHDEGFGTAKNMSLWFKGVPLFYMPYLTFPIDDQRKSGLLLPSLGSTSDSGIEISVPYYWNIAPQADATITPNYLQKRGTQLNSEWRYLHKNSMNQFDLEYLNDREFNDERWLHKFTHEGKPWRHWKSKIETTSVSDDDYFDDLGNNLSIASETHVKRQARLKGSSEHWTLETRVQNYQTIDETIAAEDRPYALLPRIELTADYPDIHGIDVSWDNEFTDFDHDTNLTGQRLHSQTKINYPMSSAGAFFIPSLSTYYTQYALDPHNGSNNTNISRTVPSFNIDSGLFFERNIGKKHLQTLEPRVFYLYTPFREQNQIPIFDSRLNDFSFAQLFRENRFTSSDRIGDANQLSIALTSRIIKNHSGKELFRASIGQIHYFDDREVVLPDDAIETRNHSDLIGEIGAQITKNWETEFNLEWDPDIQKTQQGTARLRYRRDNEHIANFSYRFRDAELEETDISFRWALNQRWKMVGRWNYSIAEEQDREVFAGLEYENCCYAMRLVARRYLNENEFDDAIFFQLSFKGFTSFGNKTGQLLETGILGYEDEY